MIPVTCFPSDNSELYEVYTYSWEDLSTVQSRARSRD